MSQAPRTPAQAIEAAMAHLKLSASGFAERIDVSPQLVSFMRAGQRSVPIEKVPLICALGGDVKRWELRPDDWHHIWPELIGAPGAPEVPHAPETLPQVA